jgi:hypothetical protein
MKNKYDDDDDEDDEEEKKRRGNPLFFIFILSLFFKGYISSISLIDR